MPERIRKPPTPPRVPPEQFTYQGYTIIGEWNTPNWYRSWYDQEIQDTRRLTLGTDDFEAAKTELISVVQREFGDPDALRGDPLVLPVLDAFWADPDVRITSPSNFNLLRRYAEEHWQGVTMRELNPGMRKDFVRANKAKGNGPGHAANQLNILSKAFVWAGRPRDDNRVLCPDPPRIECSVGWVCDMARQDSPPPRNYAPEPEEMPDVVRFMARTEDGRRWTLAALFAAGRPTATRLLGTHALSTHFGMTVLDLHPSDWRRTGKRNSCVPVPATVLAELRSWPEGPWIGFGKSGLAAEVARAAAATGLPQLLPSSFRDYMATALRHAHLDFGVERVSDEDVERWMGHRDVPIASEAVSRIVNRRYGLYRPDYLLVPMRAAEAILLDLDRRSGGALFKHTNPHVPRQTSAKCDAVVGDVAEGKGLPRVRPENVENENAFRGSPRGMVDLDAIKTGKTVEIGGSRGMFRQIPAKPAMRLDEAFERQPSDILSSRSASRMLFVPEDENEFGETMIIVTGNRP